MNINDIEGFIKTYEEQSFSKASEEMYTSPQGISYMIHKMEKELNVPLFERTGGGVSPTVYGDIFFKYAVAITSAFDKARREINLTQARENGVVRLACAYGIVRFFSPEYILDYNRWHNGKHHPRINYMEFPDKDVIDQIHAGQYDIGISPYTDGTEGVRIDPLFSMNLYLIVSPQSRFYHSCEVSLQDISTEPMILENERFVIHDLFLAACGRYGVEPNIFFTTSGFSLSYKLCREGHGNTLSMHYIFKDMKNSSLRAIPIKEHLCWNVGFIRPKDCPTTDAVSDFMDYTRGYCKNLLKSHKNILFA